MTLEAPGAAAGDNSQQQQTQIDPNATKAPSPGPSSFEAPDEFKALVETKGWKAPADVLRDYAQLEKAMGARVALPKEGDEAGLKAHFVKLGAYEAPEDYVKAVAQLEGAPPIQPEIVGALSGLAAKANLTASQWKVLNEGYQQLTADTAKAALDADGAFIRDSETHMAALEKEHGAKFPQLLQEANRVGTAMGFDAETLTKIERALGTKSFIEGFAKVGGRFGNEDTFVEGQGRDRPQKTRPVAEIFYPTDPFDQPKGT